MSVNASNKAEIAIHTEIPIAILFLSGTLLIESTQFEGESMRTAKRKLLTSDYTDEIKEIMKEEICKLLEIRLTNLSDLFQA